MVNTSSLELLAELLRKVEALAEDVKQLSSASTPVIKGIQGLADYLGISKSVAQKMKNEGVIPCVQYDRIVLFQPDKVLEALERQTPKYNR
jgi:hypothetical protein